MQAEGPQQQYSHSQPQYGEQPTSDHTLAYFLDRRFSVPTMPMFGMHGNQAASPTNDAEIHHQFPLDRRMSLPMYPQMSSMSDMLHQQQTNGNNPQGTPFDMYGQDVIDFNHLSPGKQPKHVTPSTFVNAFNELLFESGQKLMAPQYAEGSYPQQQQFFFNKDNSASSDLNNAPMAEEMPEFQAATQYNNEQYSSGEFSPVSPPHPSNKAVVPTVLDRIKQGDLGKNQKFKPTESQLGTLVGVFEKNPFPSAALRNHLAEMLDIQPKQVRFWFQNRRATYKINGVYVIKPKKSKSGAPVKGGKSDDPDLAPVSSENPYFFVDASRKTAAV
ncbi:hypothetical protein HDU98_007489 [Podochytrium sp. JEL0797]|nr:hypothetical protein HDU98_007489 [Podochytrium sp. JEL0797]